jgi:hypothetical protein
MKISIDFAGVMRSMSVEKKTGVLSAVGDGWESEVWLNEGKIRRAKMHTDTGWALGEALVQARILTHAQAMKAFDTARKDGVAPEEVLAENQWVALTVLKRFRERLNMAALIELGRRSGYRMEFRGTEPTGGKTWDTTIPISYALREVSRRLESLEKLDEPLPDPEARFETNEVIGDGLFNVEQSVYGGPQEDEQNRPVRLAEDEKRVLFFCNGDVQFRNLSIVSGVPTETAAKILRRLASAGYIRPATGPRRDTSWARFDNGWIRHGTGFLQGIVAATVVVLFLAQVSNLVLAGRGYPPPVAQQDFYRLGNRAVLFEVQSSLVQYHFEKGHYPKTLAGLIQNDLLSQNKISSPLLSGHLSYTIEPDSQTYRLKLIDGAPGTDDLLLLGGEKH